MASEDRKVDGQGVGFAGLSSMVSDVDAALEGAEKSIPASTSSESASFEPSIKSNPDITPAVSNPTASGSGGKWIFGIGAVLGLIWLISISNNKNTSPQTSPTYSPPTTYSTPAPAYVAPPALPSRPAESLPPVGTNITLNSSQIRYCVAEDIRLEAAKTGINTNMDVDRFNTMVADYNSRCSNYRYKRGSLEAVQSELASFRGQLESEGRSRMSRASISTPEQKSKVTEAPKPDLTTQAIQRRLNKFGYDAGEEDGLEGQQTRSAIEAFQRDQRMSVDGKPSVLLLKALSEHVEATKTPPKAENFNPTIVAPSPAQAPAPANIPTRPLQAQPSNEATGKPDLSMANTNEKAAIERACDSARQYSGPAAYYSCLNRELSNLKSAGGKPDLSRASQSEQSAIERACDSSRQYSGPGAYYGCLNRELASLQSSGGRPDLSRASSSEQAAIERSCDSSRQYSGPGAYYSCLNRELSNLKSVGGKPDLSRASQSEQSAIERACDSSRQYSGPGAYYGCLNRELASLQSSGGRPDLSRASSSEQAAIERSCDSSRQYSGPGTYYNCLRREYGRLK